MKCNPVAFEAIKIRSDKKEYPAEAYKSMFKALEVVAKEGHRRITIEYRPMTGYVSKYSGKWRISFMGEVFYDKEPLKAIESLFLLYCKVKGIDTAQIAQEGGQDETA